MMLDKSELSQLMKRLRTMSPSADPEAQNQIDAIVEILAALLRASGVQ